MADRMTPAFVHDWYETLQPAEISKVAPDPEAAAVFSADMINGFVHEGPLSSDRVNAIAKPVRDVFQRAWDYGIRAFALGQDTHSEDTPEFRAYPPHAIAGSSESDTIPELKKLDFAEHLTIFPKNSLHPAIGTDFDAWLDSKPEIDKAIVVGNCTDLCVYQLAMHLRMRANAMNHPTFDVIVPANAVDTFDISTSEAQAVGEAHPGEFFHKTFLYHMASNGVRIASEITDAG